MDYNDDFSFLGPLIKGVIAFSLIVCITILPGYFLISDFTHRIAKTPYFHMNHVYVQTAVLDQDASGENNISRLEFDNQKLYVVLNDSNQLCELDYTVLTKSSDHLEDELEFINPGDSEAYIIHPVLNEYDSVVDINILKDGELVQTMAEYNGDSGSYEAD